MPDDLFGCELVSIPRFEDERGSLTVMTPNGEEVAYAYYLVTKAGKARDFHQWHLHDKHTDRFIVVAGAALFFLSDGETEKVVPLSANVSRVLIVPPGVLHRFETYGPYSVSMVNLPNMVYDPEDELRIPVQAATR